LNKDSKEPYNFFDELYSFDPEEAERLQKESEAKGAKVDYLIHRVFQQSEEGRELFSIWYDGLIMSPCAEPGMSELEIGIREGLKRFIRNIKLTVKRVEET